MTDPAPGIYEGITDEAYRSIKAVSKSDLDAWVRGARPAADDRTLFIGTVFHLAVLEPAKARARIKVGPDVDMRTTEGKTAWNDFVADITDIDALPLRPSEYDMLRKMVAAMKQHPDVSKLRDAPGMCEVAIVWKDNTTGVHCKAKIDKVLRNGLLDFKTTGYIDDYDFNRSIIAFNYDAQAAFYQDGWQAATGDCLPFALVPCSKREPHATWVRRLTPDEVMVGRRWYETVLKLYGRHGVFAERKPDAQE
jgi:exodeoxyribonuclease VIII